MNIAMNIEHWALIDGYDNYEISSFGRVRNNKTSRIMKLNIDKDGYRVIGLCNDNKQKYQKVHRLVAFAFLEKNDEDTEVDHMDHNKANNMLNNLRWVSRSGNQRNASKRKDNSSGHQGISYHKHGNYWYASWYEEKQKQKAFSVKKYGDQAKQMAIDYRKQMAEKNGYLNV